jgi:hypothetical protein
METEMSHSYLEVMTMFKYCELTEVKQKLDELGIAYEESRRGDAIFLYIVGPGGSYIRVSYHKGYAGYYVRHTGMIYEDVSFDDLIEMIKELF